MTRGVKRHKPRKEVKEATHEAQPSDYQKLGQAVVEAIIRRERDLYVRLPYFAKMEEEWPRGVLVKKDGQHNIFKVKCFKLADFLHSKGILPYDAKGIMLSIRQMSYLEGKIDKLLDSNSAVWDNSVSVDGAEQIDKENTNAEE